MEFVEPDDEHNQFRNPLPPEDRLWRHPSEMGADVPFDPSCDIPGELAGALGRGLPGDPSGALVSADDSRPSVWLVAAVSAVSAGLIATGLAMVVVGLMGGSDQIRPVERLMEPRPIDAITSGDVAGVADRVRAAVVQIRIDGASTAVGSGVIVRTDGHMLTSASVVGDAFAVRVTLESGRELAGRVVGTDPETDTAVVKIDGAGPFPAAVLGTAVDLRVGQQAIALGCHVDQAGSPSVTVGVISALHRSVLGNDGGMLFDMVQTDARVPPGWPGGALLDSSGSVIGITTAVATNAGASSGFGFAIPIDLARSVAEQIISAGRVTGVWLGIQGGDLDLVRATGLEVSGGAVVGEVKPGSPAALAGLEADDVIVGVDGVAVTSMGHLVVALRRHQPGDTVRIDVMRGQGRMSMAVVLVERPVPA